MPPVSITSVCPAAMIPSGAANSSMFDIQSALTVPGRATSIAATKATRSNISATIACVRSSANTLPPGIMGTGAREGSLALLGHLRFRAISRNPPIITIATIRVPWIT